MRAQLLSIGLGKELMTYRVGEGVVSEELLDEELALAVCIGALAHRVLLRQGQKLRKPVHCRAAREDYIVYLVVHHALNTIQQLSTAPIY